MKTIDIVGMGLSLKDLSAVHLSLILHADILIGGKRHLLLFPEFQGETRKITRDLADLASFIQDRMDTDRIVVLASGDPLFFGIGDYLIRKLGRASVTVYPNISSVAAAFARIKTSWQDARVVSLHGRGQGADVLRALKDFEKVAVLTDPARSPDWLADYLIRNGIREITMWVAEQLGAPEERVRSFDLPAAADQPFQNPNVVILLRHPKTEPPSPPALFLGMPHESFDHQRGMITKPEVRVVSLSKLRLKPHHVLWDLGAGSGSVSLEASQFITRGRVIAVEKDPTGIAHIQANRARFHVPNLDVFEALMPDKLTELPTPDRVFIGGGGKNLDAIINTAAACLHPGGIMVINTVVITSLAAALSALKNLDFETEIVQIQVNTGRHMPTGDRMEAANPVWIVTGRKKQEP